MGHLRISAISYLNTAPLMWDFQHGTAGTRFDISYTIPSLCAGALRDGTADIGIIPVAAYATIPDLVVLPDVAIAAKGAVRSILLVSKVPLDEIRTVALDSSSMTSVALMKVLFSKWLGGPRSYTAMKPKLMEMLREHDAGLLIGDPAMQIDRNRYLTFDLSEEWNRFTGKPFVFAFWAIRRASIEHSDEDVAGVFRASRDHGLEPDHVAKIAQLWAPRLAISEAEVVKYLTQNIHYHLDPACLEGLQLFYEYAAECGALPRAPELSFYDAPRAATR